MNRSFSVRCRIARQPEAHRVAVALVQGSGRLLPPLRGPAHAQHGGRQLENRRRDTQSHLGDCRNTGQFTARVSPRCVHGICIISGRKCSANPAEYLILATGCEQHFIDDEQVEDSDANRGPHQSTVSAQTRVHRRQKDPVARGRG